MKAYLILDTVQIDILGIFLNEEEAKKAAAKAPEYTILTKEVGVLEEW